MNLSHLGRGPRAGAILVLLCLALYLPGIKALPVTDRDEARFAQATRQMIESGDFVHIRFQNEPRDKKPAGIHWLQAAAIALAGGDTGAIWAYRLVSVLGATAAVLLLWALARPVVGPEAAFVAGLALAPSLLLVAEAHIAKTDAMLLAAVLAQQGALARLYQGARAHLAPPPSWAAWAFWGALGAGVLIKGPVAPMVALLTIAALLIADRGRGSNGIFLRALRPLPGLILAIAIAAPWFVLQAIEGDFISAAVTGDLLPKLVGAHESHGGIPGTYLILLPAAFFPASLLLAPALVWAWRQRSEAAVRFALAWALPAWVVFEAVPTKLAHYVLPLYPALALIVGLAAAPIVRSTPSRDAAESLKGGSAAEAAADIARRFTAWPARVWIAAVAVMVAVVGAVLPALADSPADDPATIPIWIAGAALAGAALLGGIAAWRGQPMAALGFAAVGFIPFVVAFLGFAMPALPLWPSREAAQLVSHHVAPGAPPVAVAGYGEPSLVFALGTATQVTDAEGAARHLARDAGALALIEAREAAKFTAALAALGRAAESLGTAEGLNTARGRSVKLTLYRAKSVTR